LKYVSPLIFDWPFLYLVYLIQVLDRIISGVEEFGFSNKGWIESPIKGAEGNMEFLACFHRIPTAEPEPEAEATKAGAT
jgi:23S rRNA (cytidine1920-2'-O)/16S rRNA (cytidine1409-2'-O)-methyltransferase